MLNGLDERFRQNDKPFFRGGRNSPGIKKEKQQEREGERDVE